MKEGTIKVGTKGGFTCKVPIREPENLEDLRQLSRGNVEVLARWANRGYRIECQERSGARDVIADNQEKVKSGAMAEPDLVRLVAEKVNTYDPTAAAARTGRTRKPVVIKAQKGKKVSPEEFIEQLRAQGFTVQFEEGSAA